MLKSLRTLLSKPSREDSAKKPATNAMAKPKPAPAGKDYGSVAVVAGTKCCSAANDIEGRRFLFREGLRLPLANCTMPTNCSCKFKKASDRRDGERREPGVSETGRWFAGPENRKRGGRRSAKD
jgi:hypothetical protein